jgi:hypothetical protein
VVVVEPYSVAVASLVVLVEVLVTLLELVAELLVRVTAVVATLAEATLAVVVEVFLKLVVALEIITGGLVELVETVVLLILLGERQLATGTMFQELIGLLVVEVALAKEESTLVLVD